MTEEAEDIHRRYLEQQEHLQKLEEIQKEYPIEIEYLNINDTDMDLSVYDFKGVPFTVVYVDGQYHHHYQGDMPIERIKEQLGIN